MSETYFKHPTALVETDDIGGGTRIWAFSHLMAGARIGSNCNIGDHCFIEGNVTVGDNVTIKNQVAVWNGVSLSDGVFVGPSVSFTNDLRPRSRSPAWVCTKTAIGKGVTVGANATILCGIVVGDYAFVAAGAVVTADVAAYALVKGNPARPSGFVCRCGGQLGLVGRQLGCSICQLRYSQSQRGGAIMLEER